MHLRKPRSVTKLISTYLLRNNHPKSDITNKTMDIQRTNITKEALRLSFAIMLLIFRSIRPSPFLFLNARGVHDNEGAKDGGGEC